MLPSNHCSNVTIATILLNNPLCFLHRSPGSARSSVLPLVFPTHLDLISRSLSTLPESSTSLLPNEYTVTKTTIFWSVVTLSAAPSTYHTIGPLVWMILLIVMTFITSIYFLATAESKPPVTLRVVTTATSLGKFGAGCQT